MGAIRWTQEAVRRLRDIHEFIARDDPERAQHIAVAIHERCRALGSDTGYRYQRQSDDHVRILTYEECRIAYRVKNAGDIDILGIFHDTMTIQPLPEEF